MNATRAAKELRPHLTEQSARKTGSRLIHTPTVLEQLERLTNESGLSERNAQAFVDSLWKWMDRLNEVQQSNGTPSRHELALGLQAARLLARIYLRGMLDAAPSGGFRIDGLDDEGIRNLVGDEPG
jgi:type II secretory pathway component PulK